MKGIGKRKITAPRILIGSLLIVTCAVGVFATIDMTPRNGSNDSTSSASASASPVAATPSELLTLVNAERAKVGVAPLAVEGALNTSAQQKADDMATYHYFGHENHDGQHGYMLVFKSTQATGSYCSSAGENLHKGSGEYVSASETVASWMGSKPHREAMLNPSYTTTGFGISQDGVNILAVEHFCKP